MVNSTVINHFLLDLSNQTGGERVLRFDLQHEDQDEGIELVMPLNPVRIPDSGSQKVDFFLRLPVSRLKHGKKRAELLMNDGTETRELEVVIVGPDA